MTGHERQPAPLGARTRRRRELKRQGRRSLGLTALAIVPGAGLTRTRFRAIGWTLLGLIALTLVALAVTAFVRGPRAILDTALRIAITPSLLIAVAGVAIAAGLVWIVSIVLTHRASEPAGADPISKFGLRLFTAALCGLVALPVVQVVRYASIQRDVVSTVFAESPVVSVPGVTQTAKPDQQQEDAWKNIPRVNMLLIGSDAGDDRTGLRTDSMVVASIDTKSGLTTLVSLPRNLERVPFPTDSPLHAYFPRGYYCPERGVGNECLLNAVWNEALGHKDLFPGDPKPGLTTLKAVISEITGLHLDYSTIIDLAGFQSLVDAMGGVTVNVTERLPINGYHTTSGGVAGIEGYIEPGRQKLDGFHALWYARSRLLSDDYSRMRRQRCLVGALLDQVNPTTMLAKYPQLA
ncbi:MAG: LCP family protein, partial [Lapillicoccus sp.]